MLHQVERSTFVLGCEVGDSGARIVNIRAAQRLEVDLLAYSHDDRSVLVGEVKWAAPRDVGRLLAELEEKARRLPEAGGREVVAALWLKAGGKGRENERVVGPRMVLDLLR